MAGSPRTPDDAALLARLAQLAELLDQDPVRAKIEIMKGLDGELTIFPRPSMAASAGPR